MASSGLGRALCRCGRLCCGPLRAVAGQWTALNRVALPRGAPRHTIKSCCSRGRSQGESLATPLLLALVCVELSDVLFAVDSIPAVFGVTTDPFSASAGVARPCPSSMSTNACATCSRRRRVNARATCSRGRRVGPLVGAEQRSAWVQCSVPHPHTPSTPCHSMRGVCAPRSALAHAVAFTSNAFALLGLRSLYTVISNAVENFVYLR